MIEQTPLIPLLVPDTNVVLDWVAFGDPRVQPIVDAIERGALRLATSGAPGEVNVLRTSGRT